MCCTARPAADPGRLAAQVTASQVTRKSIFSSMSARAADEADAVLDDVPSSARKVPYLARAMPPRLTLDGYVHAVKVMQTSSLTRLRMPLHAIFAADGILQGLHPAQVEAGSGNDPIPVTCTRFQASARLQSTTDGCRHRELTVVVRPPNLRRL